MRPHALGTSCAPVPGRGKSSWAGTRRSDDRLNARRERDVPFMAKLFAAKGEPGAADVGRRCDLTTRTLFADRLDRNETSSGQALYLADVLTLLRVVNACLTTVPR
ncbi:MAG: hypothetical protein R2810_11705 [Flavobacteriales bacterium]